MSHGPATDLRRPRGNPWPGVRPWLVMFAAAVSLRVANAWLATGPHARPLSDPATYDAVAWNLARGAGFSLEGAGGIYPTAFVPPLLPWITSLLYRAVGHDYFAAVLLGCVIGSLVPLLLAAFATRMFGSAAGRLAGWLAVVHPLLVLLLRLSAHRDPVHRHAAARPAPECRVGEDAALGSCLRDRHRLGTGRTHASHCTRAAGAGRGVGLGAPRVHPAGARPAAPGHAAPARAGAHGRTLDVAQRAGAARLHPGDDGRGRRPAGG